MGCCPCQELLLKRSSGRSRHVDVSLEVASGQRGCGASAEGKEGAWERGKRQGRAGERHYPALTLFHRLRGVVRPPAAGPPTPPSSPGPLAKQRDEFPVEALAAPIEMALRPTRGEWDLVLISLPPPARHAPHGRKLWYMRSRPRGTRPRALSSQPRLAARGVGSIRALIKAGKAGVDLSVVRFPYLQPTP